MHANREDQRDKFRTASTACCIEYQSTRAGSGGDARHPSASGNACRRYTDHRGPNRSACCRFTDQRRPRRGILHQKLVVAVRAR